MVFDENNNMIIQHRNKTDASTRDIYIPDALRDEIISQGFIFRNHPNYLNDALHKYQKKLGIPSFRFHSLRVFYCSYCHQHGMSEASIMSSGGWASPYTMRQVYRKSMEQEKLKEQIMISNSLI